MVYYLCMYIGFQDFKVRILLQIRWKDFRLAFNNIAPADSSEVICQTGILERIWIPNVYITNEKYSLTMADFSDDVMVTVLPDGNVMLSIRQVLPYAKNSEFENNFMSNEKVTMCLMSMQYVQVPGTVYIYENIK